MQYKYIDKAAIRRAIKQYPKYMKTYMPDGNSTNHVEWDNESIIEILAFRQNERISRELAAVEWMLKAIKKFPHEDEIVRAIKLILWENHSNASACMIMSVSDSTLTRRLRTAYLLVGAQLGLLQNIKVDGFNRIDRVMLKTRKQMGSDRNA